MEFGNLADQEEVSVIVDLDLCSLLPDLSNLNEVLFFSLVSDSLGFSPSIEKTNLAYLDAYAYFNYDKATYESFIQCVSISVSDFSPSFTSSQNSSLLFNTCDSLSQYINNFSTYPSFAASKKKYKPVARRTYPVPATLPEKFRILRNFPSDPLENLPTLNPIPPPFIPTGRYTQERKDFIEEVHDSNFLWPQEMALVHHLMMLHDKAFAWEEEEKGQLNKEYFPPVEMPVIEHVPWRVPALPIPPGLFDKVVAIVREKIRTGVYEPSNSSYRTRWFAVVKKDGTSL
jgi:hypothetical protein